MGSSSRKLEQPGNEGISARRYRRLMGCFPTGVAVLTARDADGEPAGSTVNAVTSVSLKPPVLLVCLQRDSATRGTLLQSPEFALNVLSCRQEELSRRFANASVEDRFQGVEWEDDLRGVPVLEGAAAHIACRAVDQAEVGDHTVFYALVTGGDVGERRALLFCRGEYHAVEPAWGSGSPDSGARRSRARK